MYIFTKKIIIWISKPFTTYVEPIIESLYANRERFDESNAPQLEPLALEIPEGLDDGIVIAQIKTQVNGGYF